MVPFRELVSEGCREVLHLEKKLFTSLRLLMTQPGALTTAYFEGRRTSLLSPVRLYVMASVVFGAALVFSDEAFVMTLQGAEPDRNAWLRFWLWSVVFMMPIFAGLMKLVIRRGHYFVEHLVFAIHLHAFLYLLWAITLPIMEISGSMIVNLCLALVVPVVMFLYFVTAVRRRYELALSRSLWTVISVSLAYCVFQFAAFIVTGTLASRFAFPG